jgi:N-acetyl-gamma-glutamylphosphate reductase
MKALLIGATGATGKDLLELLLQDKEITKVDVFVRRALDVKNEKLTVHIIDFDKPEQWKTLVQGDVLFSCLGTTPSPCFVSPRSICLD